jgi:hypothetical protein
MSDEAAGTRIGWLQVCGLHELLCPGVLMSMDARGARS